MGSRHNNLAESTSNSDDEQHVDIDVLPTIKQFYESRAYARCIAGPVGSGKTTAAVWLICNLIPHHIYKVHNQLYSRWVVVRNTYSELSDTTQRTLFEWFPWGGFQVQKNIYRLRYKDGPVVEILFRSCDRPQDVKKFKSLEITGAWVDESIEVAEEIKMMLKNRIGRYPRKSRVRFFIETTNPPDIEHPTMHQYKWIVPPPVQPPDMPPLKDHEGFWQPPHENDNNLRDGYYDDLINDYKDNPDWIARYVNGMPGIVIKGRVVYRRFVRDIHVARDPLIWAGGTLYRGWDNSGNCPAAVVCQVVGDGQCQILREFVSDIDNIVDFTRRAVQTCNLEYPGAKFIDYGDPAGANKFSRRDGGFTSNAELMRQECGVLVIPSDNNISARINAVDSQLARRDGLLISPNCVRLINGFLGGYCYSEIGTTGKFAEKPEKNRFSHIHDSTQYVLLKLFKSASQNISATGFQPVRKSPYRTATQGRQIR